MNRAALVMATTVALFISVQTATAATRRVVNTGQTNQQIISVGATTGAVSTPNGYAAYYGQDHVDEHTAGNRYQAGQSVPTSGGTSSASSGTVKVKVKPVSMLNKAKTAAKAVSGLRGGIPGLIATTAVTWAIEQIPGARVQDGQLQVPEKDFKTQSTASYFTTSWTGATRYKDLSAACTAAAATKGYFFPEGNGGGMAGYCVYKYSQYSYDVYNGARFFQYSETCPTGKTSLDGTACYAGSGYKAATDADYAALQAALASVQNSEWLRDLVKKSCEGSSNPAGCYDDLVDYQQLTGPASQTGQTVTTSQTTSNPDGTTSTNTTSSTNTYHYTYGPNYYDYTITNNTSVNNNGQVTTTTTTDTTDPTQPETETPPEEDEKLTAPALGNPYSGVTDKYNQIKGEVESTSVNPPSISVSPWYSFTGQCSELTLELPVIGMWSTAYCPIIFNIVHPILTFLFILFTYHSCREYWDEAVRTARPI